MVMEGEALTTSMEEMVSEVGAGVELVTIMVVTKVIKAISKTKLKIKTKPLVVAMLINLLVKITKDERVHSASIVKGIVQISIISHFCALG